MFDYQEWTAESFSDVTNVWIFLMASVNQQEINMFANARPIPDSSFGFFTNGGCLFNAACDQRTGLATLSQLGATLGTATLSTDIFIGGRSDLNEDRHYKGKIAGLTISSNALSLTEVACIFGADEGLLPGLPTCDAMVAELMMGGNVRISRAVRLAYPKMHCCRLSWTCHSLVGRLARALAMCPARTTKSRALVGTWS